MSASRVFGEAAALLGDDALSLTAIEDEVLALCRRELPTGAHIDSHVHIGRDSDGHGLGVDDLVADLDRAGIERAVCFPPNDPGEDGTFRDANDVVLAAAAAFPDRIIPFARVDPERGATAEIARASEKGARGLKLHPVAQRFRPESDASVAAVRAASTLGWAVVIHAGFGARRLAEPIAALADATPGANLILAHAGRGDAAGLAELARGRDGVWFDTSLASLVDVVELPPSRLLFGSDRPYGEHASAIQLLALARRLAGWDDDEMRAILGGNARRLIRVEP